MRKTLPLSLILISFKLLAQTNVYHPFPESNAHWTESTWWVFWSSPPCVVHDNYTLFISGDTIIGANTYHKIFKSGFIGAPPCNPPGYYYYNNYAGAFRQDTLLKKVYFINGTSEQLLYDFNSGIGDTLPASYNNGEANYVSDIDSVLVGTNYHKRFLIKPLAGFSSPPMDTNIAIIEGVGSTFGLYNNMTFFVEAGGILNCFANSAGSYPDTTACSFATSDNEFQDTDVETEIFPNPSTGVFSINSSEKFEYSVYDVFGRQVLHSISQTQSTALDLTSCPKGIYFVRGKTEEKIFSRKIILQ